ncbi:hypothetical protein WA026_021769 [Henosepilachna vigintioctopunctata]|uniref:Uncharacterized protein n=1 Tax=Henosepilachna vigintioctopunctata TaxID=420089 RepID=A0AAW1TSF9_9CUCU
MNILLYPLSPPPALTSASGKEASVTTLISNYKNYEEFENSTDPKILGTLSLEAREAINNYIRVVLRGKLGRSVSVIIHRDVKICIDNMIESRLDLGISDENPYVFGLPSIFNERNRYIRACQLMREYSELCGASNPITLRGTSLRKHIVTQDVALQLSHTEIGDLATFMGHSEQIHRQHYGLSIGVREVGIISNLLEKAQGQVSKDHNDQNLQQNINPGVQPILRTSTSYSCLTSSSEESSSENDEAAVFDLDCKFEELNSIIFSCN